MITLGVLSLLIAYAHGMARARMAAPAGPADPGQRPQIRLGLPSLAVLADMQAATTVPRRDLSGAASGALMVCGLVEVSAGRIAGDIFWSEGEQYMHRYLRAEHAYSGHVMRYK